MDNRDTQRDSPNVSVIIPTRNRAALTLEALASVQDQSFQGWEAIVVDDVSDDPTPDRVAALAEEDRRVRLIRRTGVSAGPAACRNEGLRQARGRYVMFLDSDDLVSPDCLAQRTAVMEADPELDFAIFRTGVFSRTLGDQPWIMNRDTGEDDLVRFLRHDYPWCVSSPIWRRDFLTGVGGFDEGLPVLEDVDLAVRALVAGATYRREPRVDFYYRIACDHRERQSSGLWSGHRLPHHEQYARKVEALVRDQWSRLEAPYQRALASHWFLIAQKWNEAGQRGRAQRAWREARRRGLVSWRRYAEGRVMLCAQRSWAAPLVMYYLCRAWPQDMFIGNERTLCHTLPDDPPAPVKVPFEQMHPHRAYHEVLRDGWQRYVARRLTPTRLARACWSRVQRVGSCAC